MLKVNHQFISLRSPLLSTVPTNGCVSQQTSERFTVHNLFNPRWTVSQAPGRQTVSLTYSSESFFLLIALPWITVSMIMCAFDIIVWQCVPQRKMRLAGDSGVKAIAAINSCGPDRGAADALQKLQTGVFHSVRSVRIPRRKAVRRVQIETSSMG